MLAPGRTPANDPEDSHLRTVERIIMINIAPIARTTTTAAALVSSEAGVHLDSTPAGLRDRTGVGLGRSAA
jgi:hypothetical protein